MEKITDINKYKDKLIEEINYKLSEWKLITSSDIQLLASYYIDQYYIKVEDNNLYNVCGRVVDIEDINIDNLARINRQLEKYLDNIKKKILVDFEHLNNISLEEVKMREKISYDIWEMIRKLPPSLFMECIYADPHIAINNLNELKIYKDECWFNLEKEDLDCLSTKQLEELKKSILTLKERRLYFKNFKKFYKQENSIEKLIYDEQKKIITNILQIIDDIKKIDPKVFYIVCDSTDLRLETHPNFEFKISRSWLINSEYNYEYYMNLNESNFYNMKIKDLEYIRTSLFEFKYKFDQKIKKILNKK